MRITKKLIKELEELGDINNLLGEPYKSSAYVNAAITLKTLYNNDKNHYRIRYLNNTTIYFVVRSFIPVLFCLTRAC
mgnify:CR=1 FL=1